MSANAKGCRQNCEEAKYLHDWFEVPPQHVCQCLNSEVHGAFSSDQDRPLPLSFAFLDSLTNPNNATGSIPNASIYGLVEHHHTAGEFGIAQTKSGGAGLANDYITWAKEGAECLCQSVSAFTRRSIGVTYAPEEILLEAVVGLEVELWIWVPSDAS